MGEERRGRFVKVVNQGERYMRKEVPCSWSLISCSITSTLDCLSLEINYGFDNKVVKINIRNRSEKKKRKKKRKKEKITRKKLKRGRRFGRGDT